MFVLAVTIAILGTCIHGAILPPVPRPNGRIEGGKNITIDKAPYQVSLLGDYSTTGNYIHVCGGAIISDYRMISAAQCTHGTRSFQWRIRAGSTYHDEGGEIFEISKFIQNPSFNSRMNNDIVLLFLKSNFTFDSTIQPINLPNQGDETYSGNYGDITGWGRSEGNESSSIGLRTMEVVTISFSSCVETYSTINMVTNNMVCTRQSFCKGDIGGPLKMTFYDRAVGLMSWGYGCDQSDYPGVYTRVSMYRNWIDANQ